VEVRHIRPVIEPNASAKAAIEFSMSQTVRVDVPLDMQFTIQMEIQQIKDFLMESQIVTSELSQGAALEIFVAKMEAVSRAVTILLVNYPPVSASWEPR
jgi:hypothetical protein